MTAAAYQEKVDDASEVLDWISAHLNDEEREHLALELLDTTRRGDGYEAAIGPWALMVLVRETADYEWQVKEFRNLETSGDLFSETSMSAASFTGSLPSALAV